MSRDFIEQTSLRLTKEQDLLFVCAVDGGRRFFGFWCVFSCLLPLPW
jgi:hypothetical protein